jgi:GT2 family glycosyltransferase
MMSDRVSIIIPCLFRPEFLPMISKCLEGLSTDYQVILIGNDSYAINVNNGLKAATGDYLVICNNDIEFLQLDWLDHLLKPLKEGYDISSIRVSDSDGFTVEDRYEEDAKFGSLWAMTRKTYETLGPLDESFGNYFEDLDYHQRAKEAGLRVVKNHAGLVDHQGKATFKEVDPEDKNYQEAMDKFKIKYGKVL